MRSTPAPLIAYFSQAGHKCAYCLSITSVVGTPVTVRGTAWDENLTIAGDGTYYSTSGGAVSNIEHSAALNVDNAEIRCNFDAITAEDIKAGKWDGSTYQFFRVNPDDTTMGRDILMTGTIGNFTVRRLDFMAELRGRLQKLQQSFGRIVTPTCPYILGDSECTKDLTAFTVTGTLDDVSDDGLTLYDSARVEAGPSGGVDILSITNADPAVITTDGAHGFTDGQTVYLSAIVGPSALNGTVTARTLTATTFELEIDTSNTTDYPPYVGSGVATPMGGESGYFDGGKITIGGLVREVKAYVPGQWTLQDSFPSLAGNEAYSMVAGDDKTALTCRVKFNNLVNFGGYPFVPGNDKIMQVGRQQ